MLKAFLPAPPPPYVHARSRSITQRATFGLSGLEGQRIDLEKRNLLLRVQKENNKHKIMIYVLFYYVHKYVHTTYILTIYIGTIVHT